MTYWIPLKMVEQVEVALDVAVAMLLWTLVSGVTRSRLSLPLLH